MAKLMACIIFLIIQRKDGDQSLRVWVLKAKPKINDQLTGYGHREYNIQATTLNLQNQSWTRLAFAGLKFAVITVL